MQTLRPDEVQRVLRRAAELERRAQPHDALVAAGQMTRADVTQIADEVGIAPDAVSRALAELDSGVLSAAPRARGWLDRVVGPADVVATRSVAGPAPVVRHTIERYFRAQLMQVKRNLGERGLIWEPAGDLWSRLRRTFDIGAHLEVPPSSELETAVVEDPAGNDRVLVRLVLRLAEARKQRATRAVGGALAGVALGVVGVAAFHTVPLDVLSALAGSGAAAASMVGARSRHHRDLVRAEASLQRFLDMLEHGR
jgi:hypothetical protein